MLSLQPVGIRGAGSGLNHLQDVSNESNSHGDEGAHLKSMFLQFEKSIFHHQGIICSFLGFETFYLHRPLYPTWVHLIIMSRMEADEKNESKHL